MKRVTTKFSRSLRLFISALAMLGAQQAFAIGTPAGDTVSNVASVQYRVGGELQDPIASPAADFTVDRLVDFTVTVTDAASSSVTPGGTGVIASLLLTNEGNADTDFRLEGANVIGGSVNGIADLFDMDTPFTVYADIDASGTLTPGDTEYVDELSSVSGSNTIGLLVVADAPATPTPANGAGATVDITVTASSGIDGGDPVGTPLVDDAGGDVTGGAAQIVLATGAVTVQDGFVISSAIIGVSKISEVQEDPFNGTSNPKAIPGAIVEYEITATNTGAEDATGVGFIDDLSTLPVSVDTGGYPTVTVGGPWDAEVEQDGTVIFQCTLDLNDATTTDGCGVFGDEVRILPAALTLDNSGGATSSAIARFRVVVD